jgi:FkbM family methyltransferase
VKTVIRRALRNIGYDLVRYVDMPQQPFDILTLLVASRIAAGLNVHFIQIGANDGIMNDPIRHLVVKHDLPGLFVEPLPDLFVRLQANYAGHPRVAFEQCAVGERDGHATIYRVRPDPDLPQWLQGLASFNKRHLSWKKFGFPGLEQHVEPVRVPVLALPSLLRKHNLDGCDLLQVDTEGYDCRIVLSALRAGLRPAIINYEFIHANLEERAQCKRLLADHGYAYLDVGRDTLAIHKAEWIDASTTPTPRC